MIWPILTACCILASSLTVTISDFPNPLLYNQTDGTNFSPFSYSSCKNTPFGKPNESARAIFIYFKTDRLKKSVQIFLATLYNFWGDPTIHCSYRGLQGPVDKMCNEWHSFSSASIGIFQVDCQGLGFLNKHFIEFW